MTMTKSDIRRNMRTLRKSGELAVATSQVIAMRTARMQTADWPLSARDQREFSRMGTEKLQAFSQAGMAMGVQMAMLQQQWAWHAASQWASLWRSLWTPWAAAPRAGSQVQLQRAMLKLMDSGLAPIHRTARANAQRLSVVRAR